MCLRKIGGEKRNCFDVCFRLLTLFQELQPPKNVILFPAAFNNCLPWKKTTNYSDIRTAVVETTAQGAAEW
jgi:hypothetical protein